MRDKKWEYKLIILKPSGLGLSPQKNVEKFQEELNQLGQIGWELVEIEDNNFGYPVAYMKR